MNEELYRLLVQAKEAYERLTPDQKREMQRAQCKSWVIGEMMLEHPEMTRERAEALYAMVDR